MTAGPETYASALEAGHEAVRRGSSQDARPHFARAASLPATLATVRMQEARQLLEEAQASFKRLNLIAPRVSALNNLGITLYVEGEYQRAMDVLEQALEAARE
jgi:Flp pilus assembly protein TadD